MKINKISITGKRVVQRADFLATVKYELPKEDQKLVDILLAEIRSRKKIGYGMPSFEFPVLELARHIGVNQDNPYSVFRRITERLNTTLLEIYDFEAEEYIQATWVAVAKYNRGAGTVTLRIADELEKYICDLDGLLASYELRESLGFQRDYTIRFFHIWTTCIAEGKRSIQFSLDEFRERLGIRDGKYQRFQNLIERVIDPSKDDLQTQLGQTFDIQTVHKGRGAKTVGVVLTFPEGTQDLLIRQIMGLGINRQKATKVIAGYEKEYIQEKLNYTDEYRNAGNRAGVFLKALENNYKIGIEPDNRTHKLVDKTKTAKKRSSRKNVERGKIQSLEDQYQTLILENLNGVHTAISEEDKEKFRVFLSHSQGREALEKYNVEDSIEGAIIRTKFREFIVQHPPGGKLQSDEFIETLLPSREAYLKQQRPALTELEKAEFLKLNVR